MAEIPPAENECGADGENLVKMGFNFCGEDIGKSKRVRQESNHLRHESRGEGLKEKRNRAESAGEETADSTAEG